MTNGPFYYGIDVAATGQNIRHLRKTMGLTVHDIQQYIGFEQPQSIYKWERGETIPSLEHLIALSQLFCLSIEDILVWTCQGP